MIPLKKAWDRWRGHGDASITTPPLDGAFRPNDRLDAAEVVLQAPAPDGLALTSLGLVVSSERSLLLADKPAAAPAATFEAEISALTGLPDGGCAAALVDGRIAFVGGQHAGKSVTLGPNIQCITALAPQDDGALLVANGSSTHSPGDWRRDLMEKSASGSLWRFEPTSGARTQLAAGLAYPYGVLDEGAYIVVSESWRSALTRVERDGAGARSTLLDSLPAYPSRLSRGADGVVWLALFAPRSQLVEFVLSEDRFRRRMVAEIHPDDWVAPCLRSGRSPLEPTQRGGVKQLGVLKPWSPSRSYGLIARLDRGYRPKLSFHSRANGHRHGVTSCLSHNGRVYFAAKGDGVVAAFADAGLQR